MDPLGDSPSTNTSLPDLNVLQSPVLHRTRKQKADTAPFAEHTLDVQYNKPDKANAWGKGWKKA